VKKPRKIARKVFAIGLSLVLVALSVSTIFNRVMLRIEVGELSPPGTMVDVGGHQLHVFSAGPRSNVPSLVLLAGSATIDPVYNFKPLWSLLSNQFHVVVVEEAGYGYSDIYDTPRDAASKLADLRQALTLAGESGPYILVPHSMSGIEALYWAQTYPDEVKGIVGLDMAVPDSYDDYNFSAFGFQAKIRLAQAASWLGLLRIGGVYPLYTKDLSANEIQQQKLLLHRNAFNIDYINEGKSIKANAALVKANQVPDVPYLMFTSNGEETGQAWIAAEVQFAHSVGAELASLDCGHYVFQCQPDQIAAKIAAYAGRF